MHYLHNPVDHHTPSICKALQRVLSFPAVIWESLGAISPSPAFPEALPCTPKYSYPYGYTSASPPIACFPDRYSRGVGLERIGEGGAHSLIPEIFHNFFLLQQNNTACRLLLLSGDWWDCVMVNCGRTMASTVFSSFKESSTLFI